jgi:hypothetical protein
MKILAITNKSHDCHITSRVSKGLFWVLAIGAMLSLSNCASRESYDDRYEAKLMQQKRLQQLYVENGGSVDEARAMFPAPRYKTIEEREALMRQHYAAQARAYGEAADAFGAASRELATNPWLSPSR